MSISQRANVRCKFRKSFVTSHPRAKPKERAYDIYVKKSGTADFIRLFYDFSRKSSERRFHLSKDAPSNILYEKEVMQNEES